MANLADDQYVQRTLQNPGDFGRDHHTPAGQAQNDVGSNVLFGQVTAQSLSSFGARGKSHVCWSSNLAHPADLAMTKEMPWVPKGASCYNHQAARGDRLPLLPDRRRGLGRGGPFYWIPLSPSLSPLVPRGAREKKISRGCNKMRPRSPDLAT